MVFTGGITVLTGIIFGIAPAIYVSRTDLTESLKTGWQHSVPRASKHLRNALAIMEVSLAVVLVIGAGLMVKSLWELSQVYLSFRSERVLTAHITPTEQFCAKLARSQSFYRELVARMRALPGVLDAALTDVLPLEGGARCASIR